MVVSCAWPSPPTCCPGSGSGASDDHEASRESLGKGGDNRYTLFHSTEAGFSGGCWRGTGGPWRTSGTRKTWCHFLVFIVKQLVCCRGHPAIAGIMLSRFILVLRDATRLEMFVRQEVHSVGCSCVHEVRRELHLPCCLSDGFCTLPCWC